MRTAARAGFLAFTERFEGATTWLYLDVKGLVTIGFGNLADPFSLTSGLSFEHLDGTPALTMEVVDAWHAVKTRQDLAPRGGGIFASLPGNAIRATRASIVTLCDRKLSTNELTFSKFFPGFDTFAADAQLLIHSMAWAMGAGAFLGWPHFRAAANGQEWDLTAEPRHVQTSCQMDESRQNEAFHQRNLANLVLARNAAEVRRRCLDPSILYWPRDLAKESAA